MNHTGERGREKACVPRMRGKITILREIPRDVWLLTEVFYLRIQRILYCITFNLILHGFRLL